MITMNDKGEEIIYKGFYTYKKLLVESKGEEVTREQIDIGRIAAALVYNTQKKKYILVKQHRLGAGQKLLEIVAGIVENKKADPEKIIRKEIKEETGYTVDKLEQVKTFYSSPGASTEQVFLYYAEVSQKVAEGGGLEEEHEDIEVLELDWEELLQASLQDSKTIIAVQWEALKRQQG